MITFVHGFNSLLNVVGLWAIQMSLGKEFHRRTACTRNESEYILLVSGLVFSLVFMWSLVMSFVFPFTFIIHLFHSRICPNFLHSHSLLSLYSLPSAQHLRKRRNPLSLSVFLSLPSQSLSLSFQFKISALVRNILA